jgi:arginine decarboxylase
MDHSRAPVLEALQAFRRRGDDVFGPPGHKQGRGADPRVLDVVGADVFASDVLSLNGLDDRRESQGVITQAEELMADAVRAEHAFFSTCGSSLSVKTAIISVAGPGEKLLVARNAHKSIVGGLVVGGVQPVWIPMRLDPERQLAHPPGPQEVAATLAEQPDAKGVLVVTPTDWGSCADLAGIAQVAHERGIPLLVDEAWGAHLPFHDDLPAWGMDAGADLVVTSVHKMGAAVEQSSVFHLQGDLIDRHVLTLREDMLGTTSSSSLVYATLDGWRRQMVEHGRELIDGMLALATTARSAIAELDGLEVMGREVIGPDAAYDLDPLRISVDVRGLGTSGFAAAEWLRARCHVDVGASDSCRINAQIALGDDERSIDRLVHALQALVKHQDELDPRPDLPMPRAEHFAARPAVRPRDAFFGRTEQVPWEKAVGRIAAEMLSPYPPGVPLVVPGEVLVEEVLDYLRAGVQAGMLIPDAVDRSLETLRVVA